MSISNNHLKKVEKKLKKLQHVVSKETGVKCVKEPTKILAICNAGLVNGLTEDVVVANFQKYGILENLILLPGKSCCFLSYKDIDSAKCAYEECNGLLDIAQDYKPVYLSFVDKLPKVDVETFWNQFPSGLIIIENFINEDEENKLLSLCEFNECSDVSSMKNRQVKHYGYEFCYDIKNVNKTKPLTDSIPTECEFLWQKLAKNNNFHKFSPDQLTVNHYNPGQGIPHHIDTHSAFEDPIMSLSLKSSIIMEFKNENQHLCVFLPQRSLAIISGESRYDWTHGITPRKFDVIKTENGFSTLKRNTRISFTFRKVLKGECNCNFPKKCDSFNKKPHKGYIENSLAMELEKTHVHAVYENIVDHFSSTRHKPWPNVFDFVNSFEPGSILIDVGCGNGKYLGHNNQIFEMGCDVSSGLLNVCQQKGFEIFASNCLHLTLRDNIADGAISIAVIHHLANEERRLKAVREMVRVLKKGGRGLIYVWAKDQQREQQKSSYIKQDRKNRKNSEIIDNEMSEKITLANITLPVHANRTQFKYKDLLVPWKLKNENKDDQTFLRFYHVFDESELFSLCKNINNIEILKSYYDQGNWCIIFRKIKY